MTFILFLPFIVILYFLFWRPQQQRVRRQQELIRAIDVGDRVVTAGGLIGRVVEVNDDRMHLEVADGVVIELLRLAVSRRLDEAEPGFDDASSADDELEEDYEEEYPEEESGGDDAVAQAGAATEAETEEASKSPPEPTAAEPAVVEPVVVEPAVVEPAVVEPAAGATGAASKDGAASGSGSGMTIDEAAAPSPGQDSH